jgi:hypothetical protein
MIFVCWVSLSQELAGFYVYCTQILGWLPPLVFTGFVEADMSQNYALMSVSGFFIVATGILRFAAPWDDILKESDPLDRHDPPTGEEEEQQ